MAIFNDISFPSHEGLPWATSPPAVDGFTDLQPGVDPPAGWRLEAGYTGGPRFSYADGGVAIQGARFQGIRDASGDFLYLGFDIRIDPTFDPNDRIIILLQKAHSSSHSVDERRIDIGPLYDSGAEPPDDPVKVLGDVGYRYNKAPQFFRIFKRNPNPSPTPPGAASWGPIPAWGTGADATGDINPTLNLANFRARVTSSSPSANGKNWTVELKIPTKKAGANGGGSGWMDLTNDIGLYLNMLRVCSTAACLNLPPIVGDAWSTQFTWPFNPAAPTAFIFTDPVVGGSPLPAPTPEFWDIPASAFGAAHLLAPFATNPSRGVKFQGGINGIGVLTGTSIGSLIDMRTVGNVNTLVARLINDHMSNPASGVTAEFRIAAFGIGGTNATWEKTPAPPTRPESGPNPAAASGDIPIGGTSAVDITSDWHISSGDRTRFSTLWYDQCLWVQLDSTAGANIAQSSVRRNLTVRTASTEDVTATVSGQLDFKPGDGSNEYDYWLHTAAIRLPSPQRWDEDVVHDDNDIEFPEGGDEAVGYDELQRRGAFTELNVDPLLTGELALTDKPAATWLWVSNGYWRTGSHLTLDGQRYAIWLNTGSFGSVVHHYLEPGQTPADVDINVELFGNGFQPTGDGGAYFRVPEGGQKKLVARIRAGTPEELAEPLPPPEVPPDEDKPGPGPGPGPGPRPRFPGCTLLTLAFVGVPAVLAVLRYLRR